MIKNINAYLFLIGNWIKASLGKILVGYYIVKDDILKIRHFLLFTSQQVYYETYCNIDRLVFCLLCNLI